MSLWSCELFDKHKHPEPTPIPKPDQDKYQDEEQDPKPQPGPVGKIPADMVGKWTAGHFSWGEFWTQDGSYTGNAVEVGIAFDFKADGTCKFYFVTGGTSFGCRTEAFVYEKGTVAFHANNSSTFTPTEGNARGFYKGCASSYKNYNKKHAPADPDTYYYTREKDSQGNDKLIIHFKPDAENYTTFYRANW